MIQREIRAYIEAHYTEETPAQMAIALNMSPSGIEYHLERMGLKDKVKRGIYKRKREKDPFMFDPDGIPKGSTWLV